MVLVVTAALCWGKRMKRLFQGEKKKSYTVKFNFKTKLITIHHLRFTLRFDLKESFPQDMHLIFFGANMTTLFLFYLLKGDLKSLIKENKNISVAW